MFIQLNIVSIIFYAVHGFNLSEYRNNESVLALVDDFQLFVKGESLGVAPTLSGLPGSLVAESVTALGEFALEFVYRHYIDQWASSLIVSEWH